MSNHPHRRPRRHKTGAVADPSLPTSAMGFLNREERTHAEALGITGARESPIPCQCPNGHRWFAPGFFQAGVGTHFDNGDDRWCPECGEPEEFSWHLEPRGARRPKDQE
jgi:hypothetical protein